MLSPGCKPGDKESDPLITALINSDGDEAAEVGGSGSLVQAAKGDIFPFRSFSRKGQHEWVGESKKVFLWISPACLFSSHPELAFLEKAAQSFQWGID